jgi:hypothetical protein
MRLSELKSSYTQEKRANERFDFWLYNVGRRFSWPVAWAAVKLGVRPTTVTFASVLFVYAGGILISVGSLPWQLLGALFYQLWIIFDCADGSVARATGQGSKRGEFADALGGYSVSMTLYTAMGIAAGRAVLDGSTTSLLGLDVGAGGAPRIAGLYLLAGVGGALLSLFSRLLYQKYINIFQDNSVTVKPRDDRGNPLMVVAQNIAANSGFVLPLTFVALLFGRPHWFALFYLAVNGVMLLFTLRRTLGTQA